MYVFSNKYNFDRRSYTCFFRLKYLKMMRPKTLKHEHKIGRNDPCPCGSGRKYKNCCLESGKYEKFSDK